jgi:hypothetical protein
MDQAASKKSGDDFRHEENYKQGIVALRGFRRGLNPLARNEGGFVRGFDGTLPRLLFLHEQHLFRIF